MKDTDLVLEVRDKSLARLGQILPEELTFSCMDLANGVGEWTLELPYEHRLRPALQRPGAGIILVQSDGREVFSGPMTNPVLTADRDDPEGTVTIKGVSDDIVLQDALAFPTPTSADVTKQKKPYDTRTGSIESLMHAFVSANIGPNAPTARRKAGLMLGPNGNRGEVIKKSARFETLGALLSELADISDLGFRVIQRGKVLTFETYEVVDRSRTIRLDAANGTLASQEVGFLAPTVTRAVVAGAGDLAKRQFMEVQAADISALEAEWGRRIERLLDERTTDDPRDLKVKGDEILAKEGTTQVSIRVIPLDEETMVFGKDWGLGDKVSVTASETEFSSAVTGVLMRIDKGGLRLGAMIGDLTAIDGKMKGLLSDLKKRVTGLEIGVGKRPREVGGPLTGSLTEALKQFDDMVSTNSTTILVMGDDAAEGKGAPYVSNQWHEVVRRRLRSWNFLNNGTLPPPLDTCYVRPGWSAGVPTRTSFAGSASINTNYGAGGLSANLGPGGAFQFQNCSYDYVKVHFQGQTGAAIELFVNGEKMTPMKDHKSVITSDLANKPHSAIYETRDSGGRVVRREGVTLTVRNAGTAPCVVPFIVPRFGTSDLRLFNMARAGSTLESYMSSSWADSHWTWAKEVEHEHVIWITGRNDMANLSPDQWGDALVRVLDRQDAELGAIPTTIFHWVERANAASPFMFRLFEDAAYEALKDRKDTSLVFLSDYLPAEDEPRQTWLDRTTFAPTPGGHSLLASRVSNFFTQ